MAKAGATDSLAGVKRITRKRAHGKGLKLNRYIHKIGKAMGVRLSSRAVEVLNEIAASVSGRLYSTIAQISMGRPSFRRKKNGLGLLQAKTVEAAVLLEFTTGSVGLDALDTARVAVHKYTSASH